MSKSFSSLLPLGSGGRERKGAGPESGWAEKCPGLTLKEHTFCSGPTSEQQARS